MSSSALGTSGENVGLVVDSQSFCWDILGHSYWDTIWDYFGICTLYIYIYTYISLYIYYTYTHMHTHWTMWKGTSRTDGVRWSVLCFLMVLQTRIANQQITRGYPRVNQHGCGQSTIYRLCSWGTMNFPRGCGQWGKNLHLGAIEYGKRRWTIGFQVYTTFRQRRIFNCLQNWSIDWNSESYLIHVLTLY